MRPKVYKHVIRVVLFSENECLDRAGGAAYDLAHLEDIAGNCIGDYRHESTTKVAPEDLHDELVAIGNDGSFFESVEEEPDWVDSHSVNCSACGELCDERDCVPGPDNEGSICPKCQK